MAPAPPPYDPYAGYHAPPVPMPAPTPIAAPSSYVPVQVELHFFHHFIYMVLLLSTWNPCCTCLSVPIIYKLEVHSD